VRLVPLLRLRHLGDRRFDYLVPPELEDRVVLGSIVRAPFGSRSVRAVVVEECADRERFGSGSTASADGDATPAAELRCVEAVADERVSEELLALAERVAERYLASYESCLRLMVPPDSWGKSGIDAVRRPSWVERPTDIPESPAGGKTLRITAKQQDLLNAVPAAGTPIAGLCEATGVGRGVLRTLVERGLLALRETPPRGADATGALRAPAANEPSLWPEQEIVLADLMGVYRGMRPGYRLLWGVTGSGKTEIYLRLIDQVLQDGGGAILLVPEIALTPQMISRVRARFGGRVGVLHSGLAKGERIKEYRRISAGLAPVVVGARSAVFAPLPRLRLIIVDEAHDSSYKQEEEPRYHASTVARMRLAPMGGMLVEGTATPSVESMREPSARIRLTRRALGSEPALEVVDMRRQGSGELLAARSREALAETLRRGEQAIVLLNRRGYAAHVHCDSCGHVMKCQDCELSLTYHSRAGKLVCHQCGRAYFQPPRCPVCGGPPLTRGAPGTERLDQELRALVPRELVFRMDSDVITGGARAGSILEAFGRARPGVLVGTQMVAKGHDFPGVTLALVADADTGLYLPDFRAAERTFQLLTQVAGRAGRAEMPGRVLVQTWNPDVPCIRMALQRDEQGFYAEELRVREHLGYPPFNEIIRLMTLAENAERAAAGARYLTERLARAFAAHELRGPVRLPTVRGRERWHLLVSSADGERTRAVVREALSQLAGPYRRRGVILLADVDPLSFG
jgi:primosomal protein N' (replication factor Y)